MTGSCLSANMAGIRAPQAKQCVPLHSKSLIFLRLPRVTIRSLPSHAVIHL